MNSEGSNPDRLRNLSLMFSRISRHYNMINRLMTFGQDLSWRRFMVKKALLPENGNLLDAGTGTGDVAFEALRADPSIKVVGVDFTVDMMLVGMKRPEGPRILWCRGDALSLPFNDSVFDAVTSGFLARNVDDVLQMFMEQIRVVKPGGRVVCLDTSPMPKNIFFPFAMFHLKLLIPLLGTIITCERDAYGYLPRSTMKFMKPDKLAGVMVKAGLKKVGFRKFMFGNVAVHWGEKPRGWGMAKL